MAQDWDLEQKEEAGWAVVEQDGNFVLNGQGHRWATFNRGTIWTDYAFRFSLMLHHGSVHVNYRLGKGGRYFVGLGPEGIRLQKQVGEELKSLAEDPRPLSFKTWHEVVVRGHQGRLQVLVDDEARLDVADEAPLLQGTIAFETLEDSEVDIDDIEVMVLAGPLQALEIRTPTTVPLPDQVCVPLAGTVPAGKVAGSSALRWVRTGGPLGGLGYDVRMRPDDPDVMFVTDAFSGVHMSRDGGKTWVASNEGIHARTGESGDGIPIFSLTIDPHDPDLVWAGTQNTRGIFKSTDGGDTWVEKTNGIIEGQGITFRGFAVDPRDSNTVYAAAEISSWAWAGEERSGREFDMTKGVVYKTTDGGENWAAVWRGDNLARYMWIDPRDPDVVYVSTGIFDREAGNSVPGARVGGGEGIVKSIDGGKTWRQANTGLDNLYVGSLFMHPDDPNVLLAGAGNNQYYGSGGVYLSTDGAESWERVLPWDDIITSVEFTLSDPDVAYAGSVSAVYRSEDRGRTWSTVAGGTEQLGWGPPGVRAGFPIDFRVHPNDPDRIFANNYGGGNFLSTDGGRTWEVASKGYTGAQVRDIAVDPVDAGRVYAAARSGLFCSADGGENWEGLSYPPSPSLEWYVVAVDPREPERLLAANNWEGVILQSHDRGLTWRRASSHPGEMMSWRSIAFAPSEPKVVYAGTAAYFSAGTFADEMAAGGVYVSRDGGTTWSPANDAISQDAHVAALAVSPTDPQVIYAATTNRGILKSTDGGGGWQALNQGLPGWSEKGTSRSPMALSAAVHPTNTDTVCVGLRGTGLFCSEDGGATWTPSVAGLNPGASISDVLFDPTSPDVMYAADLHSGVYRSDDGGRLWMPVTDGLRTRAVKALAISTDGSTLYAATEGEGVFRLDLEPADGGG